MRNIYMPIYKDTYRYILRKVDRSFKTETAGNKTNNIAELSLANALFVLVGANKGRIQTADGGVKDNNPNGPTITEKQPSGD